MAKATKPSDYSIWWEREVVALMELLWCNSMVSVFRRGQRQLASVSYWRSLWIGSATGSIVGLLFLGMLLSAFIPYLSNRFGIGVPPVAAPLVGGCLAFLSLCIVCFSTMREGGDREKIGSVEVRSLSSSTESVEIDSYRTVLCYRRLGIVSSVWAVVCAFAPYIAFSHRDSQIDAVWWTAMLCALLGFAFSPFLSFLTEIHLRLLRGKATRGHWVLAGFLMGSMAFLLLAAPAVQAFFPELQLFNTIPLELIQFWTAAVLVICSGVWIERVLRRST